MSVLKKKLHKVKRAAYAEGTFENLRWQWKAYFMFCLNFSFKPLPSSPEVLQLFAIFLSQTFSAVSSINNYISGVKTLHGLLDLPYLGDNCLELKLVLRGLKRIKHHLVKRAAPFHPLILLRIGKKMASDLANPMVLTLWTLVLLAFFTMSRKSNLVVSGLKKFDSEKQLCRKDVLVGDKGLLVNLRWSKTNQFGEKVLQVPVLALPGSVLCPVTAYKRLLSLVPVRDCDPAFCRLVNEAVLPITYSQLQNFIKQQVSAIGLEASRYSSHSLRRGGVSFAFAAGAPGELIKKQGDWSSDAYLQYLQFSLQQKMSVAQLVQSKIAQLEFE